MDIYDAYRLHVATESPASVPLKKRFHQSTIPNASEVPAGRFYRVPGEPSLMTHDGAVSGEISFTTEIWAPQPKTCADIGIPLMKHLDGFSGYMGDADDPEPSHKKRVTSCFVEPLPDDYDPTTRLFALKFTATLKYRE